MHKIWPQSFALRRQKRKYMGYVTACCECLHILRTRICARLCTRGSSKHYIENRPSEPQITVAECGDFLSRLAVAWRRWFCRLQEIKLCENYTKQTKPHAIKLHIYNSEPSSFIRSSSLSTTRRKMSIRSVSYV